MSEGIHASALIIGERGILIRGPSGAGKSALTLALLHHATHSGQFAALIGDDRIWLDAIGGRLRAHGAPQTRGLLERRGLGLLHIASEPAAILSLVVDLALSPHALERLPDRAELQIEICGILLPLLSFGATQAVAERASAVLDRLERRLPEKLETRFPAGA